MAELARGTPKHPLRGVPWEQIVEHVKHGFNGVSKVELTWMATGFICRFIQDGYRQGDNYVGEGYGASMQHAVEACYFQWAETLRNRLAALQRHYDDAACIAVPDPAPPPRSKWGNVRRKPMKWLCVVALLFVLAGCAKQAPPSHAASPCHPSEVKAQTVMEEPETRPQKTHLTYPKCPDNMRLVLPSQREEDAWYGKHIGSSEWDAEDANDVSYAHATCVPDSFGTGR